MSRRYRRSLPYRIDIDHHSIASNYFHYSHFDVIVFTFDLGNVYQENKMSHQEEYLVCLHILLKKTDTL